VASSYRNAWDTGKKEEDRTVREEEHGGGREIPDRAVPPTCSFPIAIGYLAVYYISYRRLAT
jgi:hypothetical protein